MTPTPRRVPRWAAGALVALLVLAIGWGVRSGERWLVLEGPHLLVAFRTDFPLEYFKGLEMETLDGVRARLEGAVDDLEVALAQVQGLLGMRYNVAEHGLIPVLVYPTLEAYQQDARCLICAAHVGRPLWVPPDEDRPLLPYGVHINLESRRRTVLHELVHILDFSQIPNRATPTWYEGLASYVADLLGGPLGAHLLELLPQYLKLYRQDHELLLSDYLTRSGYGRWTYNLGTRFIDFLVRRGGMGRFLTFYRHLQEPDASSQSALLERYYGASLADLEETFWQEVEATEITAEGRAAYRFKRDQIVVRYVYLRPLLKDPARLKAAYLSLWEDGRFNEAQASLMRAYLSDPDNLTLEAEDVPAVLQNGAQLRAYVATYAEDPQVQALAADALDALEAVCLAGLYAECKARYFEAVHRFIRWD